MKVGTGLSESDIARFPVPSVVQMHFAFSGEGSGSLGRGERDALPASLLALILNARKRPPVNLYNSTAIKSILRT